MSVIEELYEGNIAPIDKCVKKGSEYQRLSRKLSMAVDEFMTRLTDGEKEIFENIQNINNELEYKSEKERFIEGFCLGARIAWETEHFESDNFGDI